MDNAPQHFRTFELLYGYFKLATEKLHSNSLHLNYFAEYHGKCVCDSHFSLLSRYYRDYTMSKDYKDPIYSTDSFTKFSFLSNDATENSSVCWDSLHPCFVFFSFSFNVIFVLYSWVNGWPLCTLAFKT